jgi:Excreted virulence factor EspC, type VII ESX diderm
MDAAAVRDVADQFTDSADAVEAAVAKHLTHLGFGGATAGRAYAGRGDALRAALDHIADAVLLWSRASAEIGAALRASADRYVTVDERAGARIG